MVCATLHLKIDNLSEFLLIDTGQLLFFVTNPTLFIAR